MLALLLMSAIQLIKMQLNKSKRMEVETIGLDRLFSGQQAWQYFVISGALVGFFIGMFVALQSTTPLHTSVLYTLVPLMGVFVAKVWLGESASLIKVFGFALGSFGAVLCCWQHKETGLLFGIKAIIFSLVLLFCWPFMWYRCKSGEKLSGLLRGLF